MAAPTSTCAHRRLTSPYGQGILSNLATPKMVAFSLGLGLLYCILTFGWLTAAAVVARLGERLRTGRGLRLATERL
ncbi:MAG TPA: hypothetical protein VN615_17700 [Gaiellales bacterium]|nr:hypothetical protein [Gaiellales bacterium]